MVSDDCEVAQSSEEEMALLDGQCNYQAFQLNFACNGLPFSVLRVAVTCLDLLLCNHIVTHYARAQMLQGRVFNLVQVI